LVKSAKKTWQLKAITADALRKELKQASFDNFCGDYYMHSFRLVKTDRGILYFRKDNCALVEKII